MFPGLSEADCQAAAFRYRQLVSGGQHRQVVAGVHSGSAQTRPVSTTSQQRLGTLLVRARHRILGLHAISPQSLDAVATEKWAVIA